MSRLPRTESPAFTQQSPASRARLRRVHRALGYDEIEALRTPAAKSARAATISSTARVMAEPNRPLDLVAIIERKRGAWSAAALAELLQCSEKHIYALARSGRMPHLRIDGMIRFDPCATAEWLRKHVVAA